MACDIQQRYDERLTRYVRAMRNEKPDMVPIRPFVAEFTAKYAGYTCQEVTHDYPKAFAAARQCAAEFDWDAVVSNMVYVWTGMTKAIGLKYYGVPGIEIPATTAFQYLEPPEDNAYMRPDEYDQLIEDPTGFLFNVWLPRASTDVVAPGQPATFRSHMSFLKGGMAMMSYFDAFGPHTARLRNESGTVSAISGILKAPFDIIADKLRGYRGLCMDMFRQPKKVLAACEALMPHLLHVALSGADPAKNVPIGLWMHRGCVPFLSPPQFDRFYWPTLKQIIEQLWAAGHQTLFYAEGEWNANLKYIAQLPPLSIVYHVDRGDIFEVHKAVGDKFCLSGGIPNDLLAFGKPDDVRSYCKKVLDGVARDGGYIMDASAIMQDDTSIENVRAMTEATRTFGVYSQGGTGSASASENRVSAATAGLPSSAVAAGGQAESAMKRRPGVCVPWEEKAAEFPQILGDKQLVRRVWEDVDALAYTYIWQCLLSF
jgi:uroporphyrinogen-III decarboxylase